MLVKLETAEVARKVAAQEEAWGQREKAWVPFEVVSIVSTGGATLTRRRMVRGAPAARGRIATAISSRAPEGRKMSAVRLEALPDDRLPNTARPVRQRQLPPFGIPRLCRDRWRCRRSEAARVCARLRRLQ